MKQLFKIRVRVIIFAIILATVAIVLIGLFSGFLGSSATRIKLDHDLILPASAEQIHCVGFVSLTAICDAGAIATFTINKNDVENLISQISEAKEGASITDRPIWLDETTPNGFGREIRYIEGTSRSENCIMLTVYELKGSRVGISVRTVWN